MPRPTIDYLNAQRQYRAASSGSDHTVRRKQSDYAPEQPLELAERVEAIFAEFRSWARNLRPVAEIMAGETFDDVPF